MKVIGITGGVGAGKSTVLSILEKHTNCRIIMADDVAKSTIKPGGPAYKDVVKILGSDVLEEDGTINRQRMADLIFANEELRKKVDDIIHPCTSRLIDIAIVDARLEKKEYTFVEAALLIESGYTSKCNKVWYVYVPVKERIKRLMNSRGYSYDKCVSIIDKQLSHEEFLVKTDAVIDNSGDFDKTEQIILDLLKKN